MGPHFDRLLEESESLPLGNRAALARVAALCGDAGKRASRRFSSGWRTAPTREASPVCLSCARRIVLGWTHADLGAELAGRWSYPLSLSTSIREHDLEEPSTALAAVVHVADRLMRPGGDRVEAPAEPSHAALALAGIGDLEQARACLQLLLDAQERFDLRVA